MHKVDENGNSPHDLGTVEWSAIAILGVSVVIFIVYCAKVIAGVL